MRCLTINSSPNQVKDTLGWMARFRDQWKADPDWVELSRTICRQGGALSRKEETEAIRFWVKAYVVYRLDPEGVEYLQDPMLLMETRAGDCDDMACLAAVLLAAVGHVATPAGVVWSGDKNPTHAVCIDQTSELICDPVADVSCADWPNPGYSVARFVHWGQ